MSTLDRGAYYTRTDLERAFGADEGARLWALTPKRELSGGRIAVLGSDVGAGEESRGALLREAAAQEARDEASDPLVELARGARR